MYSEFSCVITYAQTKSGVCGLAAKWAFFSLWLTENKNKPRRLFDKASSIGFEAALALTAFYWLAVLFPGKQKICLYQEWERGEG